MARTLLDGELTARRPTRVQFALAGQADDADIRRLLRQNPMPGPIALSLEREPDYFAGAGWADASKQTIVARQDGRLVCVGSCSIQPRFVNGAPCRVGYLAGLRLDSSVSGRFDILRRGYEFFRHLQRPAPADYYFTSIASDNERARRFLERGLPGLPLYEPAAHFVTLLLPTRGRPSFPPPVQDPPSPPATTRELMAACASCNQDYQFAPVWPLQEGGSSTPGGLGADDFRFARKHGQLAAGAALWDQRAFKQIVVRGYAPWLGWARPALNLAARLLGRPRLPAVGETIACAFVSLLTGGLNDAESLLTVLRQLRGLGARRGLEFLAAGFDSRDPRLGALRRHFPCREFSSRLYLVRWPEAGGSGRALDGRCWAPELALL